MTGEQKVNSCVEYHRFTLCPDQVVSVKRRDDPASVATFCFDDDAWDLLNILRPHERNFDGRVVFSDVAPWLREDAKRYVAHLWLRTETDMIRLQHLLVSIRHLGRCFPDFRGRPIDLRARHSLEFSRRYCQRDYGPGTFQKTRRELNKFVAYVRRLHPEVTGNDFRVLFPKEKTFAAQHRPLELAQTSRIDREILIKLIDGCTADTLAYREAARDYIDSSEDPKAYQAWYYREGRRRVKEGLPAAFGPRPRLKDLLGRAIKAQVVILAACVGRRPAAICNTRLNVRTEELELVNEAGQSEKGVMVRFREFKIRNVDEEVFCPGAFGEMALQAIRTTKELTATLRRDNPQWKDYLFVVPCKTRKGATVISPKQIRGYVNGGVKKEKASGGLLQRYGIPGRRIRTYDFRHTRATNMWVGGLQVHEVAYDLGHASAEMIVRHYVAGGEESRRRFQFLIDHGGLSGVLEDFVGGREVVQARLGRHHVEIMRRQGRIITPTRYGYCCLPAASGPCTRATPCYAGPQAEGAGCDHHIESPDAIPALEEDQEVLEVNVLTYSCDAELRAWVDNQRNQLGVLRHKLERARALRQKVSGCEGGCNCDHLGEGGGGDFGA